MNRLISIQPEQWNLMDSIPRISLLFFFTLALCGIHPAHSQGTWVRKSSGNGLGNPFCVNPLNDSIIYAATGNNILRISRDKGDTWQILSVLTGGHEIKSVAVSARDTNLILVAQESGPPDRILKSTDHGSTWSQTFAKNFYYWGVPIAYLARSDNDTVYTMGSDIIWRSTNFGETWDSVRASPFESFNQGWEHAVVRPDSTNILLAADNATGIWKSSDYGVNWRKVHATTGEIPAIVYTPGNPRVMYAARWGGGGGFLKSSNGGETWGYIPLFNGVLMWGVAVSSTNPDYVITGTFGPALSTVGGIYVSRDAGITWERTYQGLMSPLNYACFVSDTSTVLVLQGDGIWKLSYSTASVKVLAPNGGQVWSVNSVQNITWSSNLIDSLRLDYTTNIGVSWNSVVYGVLASAGFYSWTVPNTPSPQCYVRIVNLADTTVFDFSDSAFTIVQSSITLISPNGGESWTTGSNQPITWSSSYVSKISLAYTVDDGVNWVTLASSIPSSPPLFNWQVPHIPSTQCRIRGTDVEFPLMNDVSDTTFTILNITEFIHALTVTDNGGFKDTLFFGQVGGATDGIDTSLGEIELPSKPPPGFFDVRWRIPGSSGSQWNLLDTLGMSHLSAVYTLEMQPSGGGYPFTLEWDPQSLPSGNIILRDESTGGEQINLDMKSDSSYVVTNSQIASLEIVHEYITTQHISIIDGWNIVSVPVRVADERAVVIFPIAISNAFTYRNGYIRKDTLDRGLGYWVKFSGSQIIAITGRPCLSETVDVFKGWNIVGSISAPLLTSEIFSIPPDVVSSRYFAYRDGYSETDTIQPGFGYWVKVRENGKIVLFLPGVRSSSRSVSKLNEGLFNSIEISDHRGKTQTLYFGNSAAQNINPYLYELPPRPPAGGFDARFASGRMLEIYHEGKIGEFPISISSAEYPVTMKWDMINSFDEVYLHVGNQKILLNSRGQTQISKLDQGFESPISLRVGGSANSPKEFILHQNHPNPFNPKTTIRYELPKESFVTLKVYNLLGQEIATLVNDKQTAGNYEVEFSSQSGDAKKMKNDSVRGINNRWASGVYFYQLVAGDFVQVRKMLLID